MGRTREKSRDGDEQEGEQHETGCSSPAPRGRGQPCLLPAGRERIKLKTGGQAPGSTGPGAARTAEEAAIPAGSSAASRAASPDAQRQKGRRFGQPDALLQGKAEQRCSHQTQPPDIKSLLATDTQQPEHHKQPQTSITQQLPSFLPQSNASTGTGVSSTAPAVGALLGLRRESLDAASERDCSSLPSWS